MEICLNTRDIKLRDIPVLPGALLLCGRLAGLSPAWRRFGRDFG